MEHRCTNAQEMPSRAQWLCLAATSCPTAALGSSLSAVLNVLRRAAARKFSELVVVRAAVRARMLAVSRARYM